MIGRPAVAGSTGLAGARDSGGPGRVRAAPIRCSFAPLVLLVSVTLVSVALVSVAQAAESFDAETLLQAFDARLMAEPAGEDVALVARELERARAGRLPDVRLRQSSAWSFDGVGRLGIGVDVTIPILDPEAVAQDLLVRGRLVLARHNERAQRGRRRFEFRRTLRLLAHVEEVSTVLDRHRDDLLVLRPGWRAFESPGPVTPLKGHDLGYLEVAQALERARREQALLLELVAASVGIEVDRLAGARIERPEPPGSEAMAGVERCAAASAESRRALLVRDMASSSAAVEASRNDTRVSLEVSGDLRYRPATGPSSSWQGDLRLALRVGLPAVGPVSGGVTIDVTPEGVGQQSTLSWPAGQAPHGSSETGARAAAEFLRAIRQSRLAALRAVAARDDAESRLLLKRLALQSELSARGEAPLSVSRLNAAAQARLALLNAELDFDLAVLAVAEACGMDGRLGANFYDVSLQRRDALDHLIEFRLELVHPPQFTAHEPRVG